MGTINSKPPGPIIMIDQSEILIIKLIMKFKDETQLTEVINGHKKLIKKPSKTYSFLHFPTNSGKIFLRKLFYGWKKNLDINAL
jgi:hypothetical protein